MVGKVSRVRETRGFANQILLGIEELPEHAMLNTPGIHFGPEYAAPWNEMPGETSNFFYTCGRI
jgi:hypothetical protein